MIAEPEVAQSAQWRAHPRATDAMEQSPRQRERGERLEREQGREIRHRDARASRSSSPASAPPWRRNRGLLSTKFCHWESWWSPAPARSAERRAGRVRQRAFAARGRATRSRPARRLPRTRTSPPRRTSARDRNNRRPPSRHAIPNIETRTIAQPRAMNSNADALSEWPQQHPRGQARARSVPARRGHPAPRPRAHTTPIAGPTSRMVCSIGKRTRSAANAGTRRNSPSAGRISRQPRSRTATGASAVSGIGDVCRFHSGLMAADVRNHAPGTAHA